jgi:hypothetical protein
VYEVSTLRVTERFHEDHSDALDGGPAQTRFVFLVEKVIDVEHRDIA